MRFATSSAVCATILLAVPFVFGTRPVCAASLPSSKEEGAAQTDPHWGKVTVELPTSNALFPGGDGQPIANSQCLICHSAGMVLRQPTRTQAQWKETINKMRSAYGAPIDAGQIDTLATYLTRVVAIDAGGQSAAVRQKFQPENGKQDSVDGAAIFAGSCAVCHQAAGTGLPGVFPPLAGSSWVGGQDGTLVQILLHGVQGALTVNGTTYNSAMPAFGSQLSDAQIAAVLTYVRSQWGNKAAAVNPTLVSAQRAATAARSGPWNGDTDLARQR
ncbi:MAG: cccA [Gammaproteobacteria bacterium]|nr:cccA [Gammaproteobacteria bacterium]